MTSSAGSAEGLRRCPGFAAYWAAATVSSFGTYVTTLAVQVLVVLTLDGGATDVGLVSAARWLPYLLFGVLAGVFVDRARRWPILVITDFVRGALLVAIPTLAMVNHLSLRVLMTFMAIFGMASLANDAAAQSFLPRVVPPPLLTRANARLDQSDAVAQTSGPALAGGLISLLTAPWAVLVDAASYVASGLLLLLRASRRAALAAVLAARRPRASCRRAPVALSPPDAWPARSVHPRLVPGQRGRRCDAAAVRPAHPRTQPARTGPGPGSRRSRRPARCPRRSAPGSASAASS